MTDMAIKTFGCPKFNGQQNTFGQQQFVEMLQHSTPYLFVHMLIIVLIMRLSICQMILACNMLVSTVSVLCRYGFRYWESV